VPSVVDVQSEAPARLLAAQAGRGRVYDSDETAAELHLKRGGE